ADRPYHVGLPGRLPRGEPRLERGRDQRGVPVRRVLPRGRRPGPGTRRRHALVPGRVRRRISRAAAVRGRAAASLGCLHAARPQLAPPAGATFAQQTTVTFDRPVRLVTGTATEDVPAHTTRVFPAGAPIPQVEGTDAADGWDWLLPGPVRHGDQGLLATYSLI